MIEYEINAVITPERIELPPGAVVRLLGDWQDYMKLQRQLDSRTVPRIKYRLGEIWLMAPLPKHGRDASLLADIAKVLLESRGAKIRLIYSHHHELARNQWD